MSNRAYDTTRGRPRHSPGLGQWHGGTLKARRMMLGRSIRDLAEDMGVGKSTVCRWEKSSPDEPSGPDRNTPTQPQVADLAALLQCNVSMFRRRPRVQWEAE